MKRRHQSSIDGFVPSNQGRHIGFGPQTRASLSQRVRTRRPGLHASPDISAQPHRPQRPGPGTSRQHARRNFPEFTTYTAPQTPGRLMHQDGAPGDAAAPGRSRSTLHQTAAPRAGKHKKAKQGSFFQRTNWKKVVKRTALLATVFMFLAGGWLGWKFFYNSNKVFGGDGNIFGFLNATKLKGEDKGQVNILLAGVSTDDPGHSGADLTDSIMLVSIDTNNKKAFMLSIPRDLWVDIPGYGHSKINAANAYGDEDEFSAPGYPSGGMGLLEQVISTNLGIPIHYYTKINYAAFRDAVNAVGGIDVNIQSRDPRGLYDPNISKKEGGPLKLSNGQQTLNGNTALMLARARGHPTPDGQYGYGFEKSDFDRTENQRMMLLALKEKLTSGGVVTNPLKIGQLFDVIGKNVVTDFQPGEIRRLYDLGKQIKGSDIQSLSLNDANGVNLLASYRSPDGASALIPAAGVDDFSAINLFLKKAMTNDPIVRESAKVVVLNGGDITGLATKFSNKLTSKGANVTAVGDAPHQEGANVIIDLSNNGKPATKAHLQQVFGNNVTTTNTTSYADADFIVIIGTGQTAPTED